MNENSTPVYTRQHGRGLTVQQQNAVDLIVVGKTDTEIAKALKLHRTTITKWRLYDPVFQAAVNQQRAEIWAAAIERLRHLAHKALDVLECEMENVEWKRRTKAADAVLNMVPRLSHPAPIGPTDPNEIVREIVIREREMAPSKHDDELANYLHDLPPLDEHIHDTWQELEALADVTEEGAE